MRAGWYLAGCALALAACEAPAEPDDTGARAPRELPPDLDTDTPLRTDRLVYASRYEGGDGTYAQYGFDLVARFTNPTADTVFLAREYPDSPHPIYAVGGTAYDRVVAGGDHDRSIVVAPGATRIDTLHVLEPNAWDGRTGEFFDRLDGIARLSYDAQSCRSIGTCPLPDSLATSHPFLIRLE